MNFALIFLYIYLCLYNHLATANTKNEILDGTAFVNTLLNYVDSIPKQVNPEENITNILKDSLIVIVEREGDNIINGKLLEQFDDNNLNEDKYINDIITKPTRRSRYEIYTKKLPKIDVPPGWTLKRRTEHMLRLYEIMDFLKDHYVSTRYFYNEAQRIRRTGEVHDDMRRMLFYLDRFGRKNNVTDSVQKCYDVEKKKASKPVPFWIQDPNNLAINVLRDPENDNTKN